VKLSRTTLEIGFSLPSTTADAVAVDRVERGGLRPDTDVRLLHEFLLGPVFYRLLLSGLPLDRALADRLLDAILPGFAV
jgi:hypothetical protein